MLAEQNELTRLSISGAIRPCASGGTLSKDRGNRLAAENHFGCLGSVPPSKPYLILELQVGTFHFSPIPLIQRIKKGH